MLYLVFLILCERFSVFPYYRKHRKIGGTKSTTYNELMRRTTKIGQIINSEFQKAEAGKEFRVDIITSTKAIPEPPVILTDTRHGGGKDDHSKPKVPKAPA
ncbi:hypothetical protein FACS1894166_03330 [Bacilli bacterium]|nr:hypothetical protein FACS1894166_03330 [Bacilli bacterium]